MRRAVRQHERHASRLPLRRTRRRSSGPRRAAWTGVRSITMSGPAIARNVPSGEAAHPRHAGRSRSAAPARCASARAPRSPRTSRTMSELRAARRHEVDRAWRRRPPSRTRLEDRACSRGSARAIARRRPPARSASGRAPRCRAAPQSRRLNRTAASRASRSSPPRDTSAAVSQSPMRA